MKALQHINKAAIFIMAVFSIILFQENMKEVSYASQARKTPESITFLTVKGNKIIDEQGKEIRLRGFHYDCFYTFGKDIYDRIKGGGRDPDEFNITLSKYFFTEYDAEEIKNIGANVIRIGIKLWQIEKEPYSYSKKSLEHLDSIINKWGDLGIYVILDLHAAGQNSLSHNKEYGNVLWNNKDIQKRVIGLWKIIAERNKNNPYIAGYDIINEPQAPSKEDLYYFYKEAIKGIREVDKRHIIFIEWNLFETDNILFGGEYDEENIALSLHFYKPHRFTHQGLQSRPKGYKYPGKYDNDYWDKDQINRYVNDILINNKLIMKKPLYVGEFSANIWNGGEDALKWTQDVINILNNKGIHFTYFEYKSLMPKAFGYYSILESANKKMKIIRQQNKIRELTEEEKRIFLTISNFESSQELRRILKEGFL